MSTIANIKELLAGPKNVINGPVYSSLCKSLAELTLKEYVTEGIYYLSESHGATLRQECLLQFNINQFKNHETGINHKYVSFDNEYANVEYNGLISRLKEMPKEWVLVQVTRAFDPSERWTARQQKSVTSRSKLHVVRYQCGENFVTPCHVIIPEPRGTDSNTASIFDVLHDATVVQNEANKSKSTKSKFQNICTNIKSVAQEIITGWIREWSCIFVGHLYDEEQSNLIKKTVDDIFNQYNNNRKSNVTEQDKNLVHCIANGCVYLTKEEIENAISQISMPFDLSEKLVNEIYKIRSGLIFVKRHPVILILDEKLECLPWEMTTPLRNNPVSRLPSIHFAHALFKEYENLIVNGNMVVENKGNGFYIIDPEDNLSTMKERMMEFVSRRFPKWKGVCGRSPEKEEFINGITNSNVFLYCGHGNGTQYFSCSEIGALRVKTIPLLFGCSSVRAMDLGGRVSFTGLSYKYLLAGCPCVIGMLWSVTSNDTDNISIALMNNLYPGQLANLKEFIQKHDLPEQLLSQSKNKYEPELLRAIKIAKESSTMYSNKAALVAYGIPAVMTNVNLLIRHYCG